jgi:hypothetical protein
MPLENLPGGINPINLTTKPDIHKDDIRRSRLFGMVLQILSGANI